MHLNLVVLLLSSSSSSPLSSPAISAISSFVFLFSPIFFSLSISSPQSIATLSIISFCSEQAYDIFFRRLWTVWCASRSRLIRNIASSSPPLLRAWKLGQGREHSTKKGPLSPRHPSLYASVDTCLFFSSRTLLLLLFSPPSSSFSSSVAFLFFFSPSTPFPTHNSLFNLSVVQYDENDSWKSVFRLVDGVHMIASTASRSSSSHPHPQNFSTSPRRLLRSTVPCRMSTVLFLPDRLPRCSQWQIHYTTEKSVQGILMCWPSSSSASPARSSVIFHCSRNDSLTCSELHPRLRHSARSPFIIRRRRTLSSSSALSIPVSVRTLQNSTLRKSISSLTSSLWNPVERIFERFPLELGFPIVLDSFLFKFSSTSRTLLRS